MLQITVPGQEMWDENKEEFIYGKSCRLRLEHSLVSLSKWESKWQKSFLSRREKTNEETVDYVVQTFGHHLHFQPSDGGI